MLELLYDALRTRLGVSVKVQGMDRERFQRKLYGVRKQADDAELDVLVLSLSPFVDDELWIVKPQ